MYLSKLLYKSRKDIKENMSLSLNRLIRGCFISQEASGIYTMLPLGLRVLKKIEKIIEEEMDLIGNKVELPFLQSTELWKKSGRYDVYGQEMLRLKDRNNQEYIIPPTCEEGVFNILTETSTSHRMLPITIYQISWKFRDELRPRSGLIRGRLFLMKDAYSFAKTEEGALNHYLEHYNTYCKIFKRLEMAVYLIKADSGEIGGDLSHEFVVKWKEGDATANLKEKITEVKHLSEIKKISGSFIENENPEELKSGEKVMELGHIFYYDTKYSEKLKAEYVTEENKKAYYYGGCYGIGLTRIMGILSMEDFWPMSVSPFQVHFICMKEKKVEGESFYNFLKIKNIEVLYDDRETVSYGEKMQDRDLIGIPLVIILGSSGFEVYYKTNEKKIFLEKESLYKEIKDLIDLV